MSAVYGWLNAPPESGAAATGMAPVQAGSSAEDLPAILAVVDGYPRWPDDELNRIAADLGHSHALRSAWLRFGADFVARISGSFSLALIDRRRGQCLIAVDRFASQPMFFARNDVAGLVFSSSAERVRLHGGRNSSVNLQSVFDYVYFHMIPSPGSFFRDVSRLEPGSMAFFDQGALSVQTYWRPDFGGREHSGDGDGLDEQLREHLRNAVRRCDADADAAAFLSGGLDSTTVCGMRRSVSERPLRAFAIGFPEEGYDEMEYARIAASHFDLELREHYVQAGDIAASMHEVAQAYDEPFGNSSAIPTLACARRAAQEGVRVMLAGDGGDELFAGNERYARQKIFEVYSRVPRWLAGGLIEPLLTGSPVATWTKPTAKLRSYVEQARVPMPARLATYNFLHRLGADSVFEPDFLDAVDPEHPLRLMENRYSDAGTDDLLDRMLYLDWKITLADNDLRKVGRMCELAGIEVRYPMLDNELVDFSTRIPSRLKLRGQNLRYFYKRALAHFLPPEIITKKKHGFGLPFGVWLKQSLQLQEIIYASLAALKHRGVVRPTFIDKLIETQNSGHAAYYGDLVWVLSMLELWLEAHDMDISG